MVAFIGSTLLSLIMGGAIVWYARKRPAGTPVTWGEAMFAATYVFFLMFWVYGVVPHQFLTWADNELKWRSDAYLYGPSSTVDMPILGNIPFNVSKQAVRDLIAVGIYVAFLAGQIALWAIWQGRGDAAAKKQKALEEGTTSFGRPLVRNT